MIESSLAALKQFFTKGPSDRNISHLCDVKVDATDLCPIELFYSSTENKVSSVAAAGSGSNSNDQAMNHSAGYLKYSKADDKCFLESLVEEARAEEAMQAVHEKNAIKRSKQAFVQYLGDLLKKDGCQVLHIEEDADTLIVNTAVTFAVNVTTVVIGEDTDLLVLLLHHADLRSRPLFLKSELKTKKHKVIDILAMKTHLGPLICNFLPFLHAMINGCDTTSTRGYLE
ncbi:hypothetical protein ElyMa_004237600 [Elysia marginata]|uniref:Asteroid domain-containing protein n=1 Tax=Elysia marginata TaxID=1093978 RepID=A0AAV4GUC9_9GAST|nr:hypothetical protein ElyMa_004237600 [Elysia marginata]